MGKPGTTVLFFNNIPKALKTRFKASCARRGKSMKDAIIHFMEEQAALDELNDSGRSLKAAKH